MCKRILCTEFKKNKQIGKTIQFDTTAIIKDKGSGMSLKKAKGIAPLNSLMGIIERKTVLIIVFNIFIAP